MSGRYPAAGAASVFASGVVAGTRLAGRESSQIARTIRMIPTMGAPTGSPVEISWSCFFWAVAVSTASLIVAGSQPASIFATVSLRTPVSVPYISTRRAMLTEEWTPLEPGVLDHKLYVRGVGTVLEQTVKGGDERAALVSFKPGR